MAKTKVWVEVDQKAAIMAGKTEFGKYLIEIDPSKFSEAERAVISHTAEWSREDSVYYACLKACPVPDTSDESIHKLITAALAEKTKQEKEEKEKAEKEESEKVEREKEKEKFAEIFMADTSLRASAWSSGDAMFYSGCTLALKYPHTFSPDTQVAIEAARRQAADREAVQVAKERSEAEKEKVRQAKKDFLNAWVSEYGTESQKERHNAGLLPSEELFGAITDHIFTSLKDEEQYVKMTSSDCDHTEQCDSYDNEGCDVDWDVEDADGATSEEWDRMKTLKSKLGVENAVVTLQEHTGETDCKKYTTKRGILITVAVECGYSFDREYEA